MDTDFAVKVKKAIETRNSFVANATGFWIGFSHPKARYFLLRGQEEVPKEKAARLACPAGSLRFSPRAGLPDSTSLC